MKQRISPVVPVLGPMICIRTNATAPVRSRIANLTASANGGRGGGSLRMSFATRPPCISSRSGVEINVIRGWLGHPSLDMELVKTLPIISDLTIGAIARERVLPVFKEDQLFRALAVVMKASNFQKLLNGSLGWLDCSDCNSQGRFIVVYPAARRQVGNLTSETWRAFLTNDGLVESRAVEDDPVITANSHSKLGPWVIGLSIKNRN